MHQVLAEKGQQRGISSVAGQAGNSTEVARGRAAVDARGAASVASVCGKAVFGVSECGWALSMRARHWIESRHCSGWLCAQAERKQQ
jgi:hypothetical protein